MLVTKIVIIILSLILYGAAAKVYVDGINQSNLEGGDEESAYNSLGGTHIFFYFLAICIVLGGLTALGICWGWWIVWVAQAAITIYTAIRAWNDYYGFGASIMCHIGAYIASYLSMGRNGVDMHLGSAPIWYTFFTVSMVIASVAFSIGFGAANDEVEKSEEGVASGGTLIALIIAVVLAVVVPLSICGILTATVR